MRHRTLESKNIVSKTLAISKVVFLSLISKVPRETISEVEKIEKTFLWPSKPKIKNETLCSDFKHGGLKNANIQKNKVFNALGWEDCMTILSMNRKYEYHLNLKENPLDHILNFTLIFYSISPVLTVFHPFT